MPALSVEFNFTVPLQLLLCVPNVVFPFLAEMHVTDNAVHGVITEFRMYQLDHGVKVLGSRGPLASRNLIVSEKIAWVVFPRAR